MFKEIADIKTSDQLKPVSYTHLDVYKRQDVPMDQKGI